jgi:uncharacterized protein YqgC (DUF456 family)
MLYLLVYLLILLVTLAAVFLNIVSLPGNWLVLIAATSLSAWNNWARPPIWALLVILLILLLAEGVEFLGGMVGAKKFGASNWAAWGAMGGAMIGGLVGIPPLTPVMLGTDHLLAAVLGAFLVALVVELVRKKPLKEASWAALGAGLGRGVGIVSKIAGGLMVWLLLAITAGPWW